MNTNHQSDDELDILEEYCAEGPASKRLKKRSGYYEYFSQQDEKTYKCKSKSCGKTYVLPKSGSNSALVKHVKTVHSELLKSSGSSDNRLLSLLHGMESKAKSRDPINNDNFKKHLINLIVCTNQPFSVVGEQTFVDYTKFCLGEQASKITVPCRVTIATAITERYHEARNNLKEILQKLDSKVSLIIDGWTSPSQHSFLGIIVQWINSQWELVRIPLDLHLLEGEHSGKNIAEAVARVISDFDIWNKLLSITTDNAANMDTFFDEFTHIAKDKGVDFDPKNQRVRCLAHILNLATKAVLSEVTKVSAAADSNVSSGLNFIDKIRQGIQKIRSSPQRRRRYEGQCEVAQIKHKELILDVPTRWDSTIAMLERVVEMKMPFQFTLSTIQELCQYIPDDKEWDRVLKLNNLLRPMREMTKMLSTGSSPTISKCASVYQNVLDHFDKIITADSCSRRVRQPVVENDDSWIVKAAKMGKEKMLKYYPSSDGLVYVVSTILDPRLKTTWFKAVNWPKEWIENYTKMIKTEWKNNYQQTNDRNNITEFLELPFGSDLLQQQMSGFTTCSETDDLKRFLSEKPISSLRFASGRSEDSGFFDGVLEWWKVNEQQYLSLARMARDFLAVSGTGVPAEQFFSGGPDFISIRRSRLKPGSITCNMCLKAWINFAKKSPNFNELFLECVEAKVFG